MRIVWFVIVLVIAGFALLDSILSSTFLLVPVSGMEPATALLALIAITVAAWFAGQRRQP